MAAAGCPLVRQPWAKVDLAGGDTLGKMAMTRMRVPVGRRPTVVAECAVHMLSAPFQNAVRMMESAVLNLR
jgi:hypothetical protein